MNRYWVIAALALLGSCGKSLEAPAYPRAVAGGYRLYREDILAKEQIPKVVADEGLLRAVRLVYDASNSIQLTVFETTGAAVAMEAKRKWRTQPGDGKHIVQTGRYLVIAQGEKPDPEGIESFLIDFKSKIY